ncbi:MAG: ATP phosphoribosyltransferase regulatory subunit [Ruminococcaceae bacterium]|nr:ATP phosphoribosyltransferase regulatory subunit [Oscillospiraceae bacterium]
MANWKLYTPDGTTEFLPGQCADKTSVENSICEVFEDFGYKVVETPVMQFYDAYTTQSGAIAQEVMYKFFDRDGRILVLRPDITTCIARMASGKLSDGILPKRLYYSGKVFRYADRLYDVSCEFCQAGIELIGAKTDTADAEVISCAIEALLSTGLEKFQIEVGQVEFFKGLIASSNISDETSEKIRALIDKKDSFAIEQLLKKIATDEHIKDLICKLPTLFGDIDVLDSIDVSSLPKQSKDAILNLKNVYSILCDYGFGKYISFDLSLVQGINCYTGIIFKGITHGIGYSICSGGRYDGLCGEFGTDLPAVGMAIETDRLISVLSRNKEMGHIYSSDLLVYCENNSLKYRLLKSLRDEGYAAEDYVLDGNFSDAYNYAKSAKIQGVMNVSNTEHLVTIHNLEDGSFTECDLCELLGEAE